MTDMMARNAVVALLPHIPITIGMWWFVVTSPKPKQHFDEIGELDD